MRAIGGLDLPGGVLVSDRFADEDDPSPAGSPWPRRSRVGLAHSVVEGQALGSAEPEVDALWALLFTSGTSAAPKAVRCTQYRLLTTGNRMAMMLELTPDDVGYAAMPLFHTNSLMSGLGAGARGRSVTVPGPTLQRVRVSARRAALRRDLVQLHGQGADLPLGHAGSPDDADNPVRVAFGNEGSPAVVEAAATRFGMRIIDVFGSTEGGIALDRTGTSAQRSIGRLREGIKVVDEEGEEAPRAVFDADGGLTNADRWSARSSTPSASALSRATTATRGDARDDPQRLVLERRSRLRRRRRLGLLRRTHLGLAPGRG